MKPETDYKYGLSKEERELMDWNEKDLANNSFQKAMKDWRTQLTVSGGWFVIYLFTIGAEDKGWQILNALALTVSVLFFALYLSFYWRQIINFICKPVTTNRDKI